MDNRIKRLLCKSIIQELDEVSFNYFKETAIKLYNSGYKIKFYKGFIRDFDSHEKLSGQLDPFLKTLKVGHVFETDWFQTYIHEYCHYLQYSENKYFFINYNSSPINAGNIELDCEKRVVQQIKKYNLPIDIPEYVMYSNAHVCLYYCIPHFNNEINDKNINKILHLMPSTFRLNFDKFIKNNYDFLKDVVFNESC